MEFLRYKHARFRARFPKEFRYSRSHYWMALIDESCSLWHVGFTKFATRMLGELVEADFNVAADDEIKVGQEIGTVEGFKAASAVYCVIDGRFQGMNPALDDNACIVRDSPYTEGYLYAAEGKPEESDLDVESYVEHLNALIDEMQKDPKYAEA